MLNQALYDYLEQQSFIRRQHRKANNLAEGLILSQHIKPHGRELICWFGHHGQSSNREALIFWVSHQIDDADWDSYGNEMDTLVRRFQERMMEIQWECA